MGHGLYNGTGTPWVMGCTTVLFDGLHNQIVGNYFQKRKVLGFVTGEVCPKKEILMAYVSRLWEFISKKGKPVNSLKKIYFQKRKF
jgi:hypothetical protein